ncbi:MAG: amino acid permease [Deltaproteobacteria bacterium]|nr:MAG: amino acid permease [Deltaproteobacteria bacterium]
MSGTLSTTDAGNAQARFGTFAGVFTPCVLTILGVIMFMRSGYVVGEVGVWQALIILAASKTITTLTTLSLSAIATNTEIRTGGVYYMISRTLGPDFGGTVGLTLFVSQAISIAFYVIGFTEALFGLFAPQGSELAVTVEAWRLPQFVSTAVILGLFFVTFKGADLALKTQFYILVILLASCAAFLAGGALSFDGDRFAANAGAAPDSIGFWAAFAIFFPAATGITAGANMSGDLKDPGRSIPNGTLAAIAFTGLIYLFQLVFLAGSQGRDRLIADPFGALQDMSLFGPLMVLGVFAATLSSALGSFLGAPRILQAMGQDGLIRPLRPFAKGHGPENEPRRATVLSLFIAVAIVWAGGLNAVAEVISMFFLIAYGMINLSAFVEARGGNPSFRPRIRLFGWPAALTGAIGCAIAMVKINETYALVAMAIAGAIYLYLRGQEAHWADATRGYIFSRTRENLLALERSKPDPKNWRPVLAVVTEDALRDRTLVRTGAWLECGRGLFSVLEISHYADRDVAARAAVRAERTEHIKALLHENGIVGFADAVVCPPDEEPLDVIVQAYSIGSLRPNTVLVGLPGRSDEAGRMRTARRVETFGALDLNVVIHHGPPTGPDARRGRIDVWWGGQKNGSLLALLAYLVSQHADWRNARIRMLQVVRSADEHIVAEHRLARLVEAARLSVEVEVILSQEPIADLIAQTSGSSDLVLLGMADKDVVGFSAYLADARASLLDRLPTTLLVASNGETDLLA